MRIAATLAAIVGLTASAAATPPTATGPARGFGLSQGTAVVQAHARQTPPRNAMEYYGVQQVSAQGPTAAPTSGTRFGVAQASAAGVKPFAGITSTPTLSPYLNLYRDEADDAAPNYFAFVRPQQEQVALNRQQSRQLQQLRRQVQQAQATPTAGGVSGRFNNTGRFYQGWRR